MKEVKSIRKMCGITQREVSEYIGINQSNYCNMENGKLKPNNLDQIQKKAMIFLQPKLEEAIKIAELRISEAKRLRRKLILITK